MPTYTYECELCGEWEDFHSSAYKHEHCPTCGSLCTRLISKPLIACDDAVTGTHKSEAIITRTDGSKFSVPYPRFEN